MIIFIKYIYIILNGWYNKKFIEVQVIDKVESIPEEIEEEFKIPVKEKKKDNIQNNKRIRKRNTRYDEEYI